MEGMKVEAVDPENGSNICVSTICRVVGGHLWLHIDGDTREEQIYAYNSFDIFPAGWCESTGHELQWPRPESKSSFFVSKHYVKFFSFNQDSLHGSDFFVILYLLFLFGIANY